MAISYVDSTTNGAGSGSAFTCSAPAGIAAGDVLICVINYNGGGNTVVDNNGATPFTYIYKNRSYNTASADYSIFYRVAGGSEPATYAFTGNFSDRWALIISAYRGVDNSSVFDVAPSASTENLDSGTPYNTKALTTLVDNAMIVAAAFGDSSSATFSSTPADSFNSRQNNSGEELIAAADKILATAGVQSAVSWGSSTLTGECALQIFSLKPAASVVSKPNERPFGINKGLNKRITVTL